MVTGIIVAAGKGIRMNRPVRKQYLTLAGYPLLCHTLAAVDACPLIARILLVIPEDDFDYCRRHVLSVLSTKNEITLVAGGAERQDSVYNGLLATPHGGGIVVIHDGVRPFVDEDTFTRCIEAAMTAGACISGIPVSDTVKQVGASAVIEKTLDRETLWLAQTPQVFRYDIIRKAHEKARETGVKGTDDALLVERMGYDVKIVPGSRYNMKITTPEDMKLAEAMLTSGGHGLH
jgi:2-C-methyl-D-erythritol 4-phosphate cytidylyltransferase